MHVLVNAATSVDGKLSTRERRQVALSGAADFEHVDVLRANVDAVLIGVGTVLADDPSLTVKDADRVHARRERGVAPQPTRVVADSRARTPPTANVVDDTAPTIVLVSDTATADRRTRLADDATDVVAVGEERVDLAAGLAALESRGVTDLLVEGGGEVVFSLFDAGLVDELSVFVAPTVIGGRDAPTLVDGDGFTEDEFVDLDLAGVERVDDGVRLRYEVTP